MINFLAVADQLAQWTAPAWTADAELHLPDGPGAGPAGRAAARPAGRMAWIHDYDALAE